MTTVSAFSANRSAAAVTTNHCASRTADKFVLRMPNGMRSHIETLAGKNQRSMNGEMIIRLERSFIATDLGAQQQLLIHQLSTRIQELEIPVEARHEQR